MTQDETLLAEYDDTEAFEKYCKYWDRFVNGPVIAVVQDKFGEQIYDSRDERFNDLYLGAWHSISREVLHHSRDLRNKYGEGRSHDTAVHIAKAAARRLRKVGR
jgi:hypothetical protein